MLESVQITAEKIKSLKVQGARNVAIAAIKSLQTLAKKQKVKNKTEFLKKLMEAKEILFLSRETEPLMRNSVRWIINQVENSTAESVKELAKTVYLSSQHFLNSLKETKEKIAEIGKQFNSFQDLIAFPNLSCIVIIKSL